MTQIAQFENGFLDLRIVRAYAKEETIRQQTGILVDFSCKLVMVTNEKKGPKERLLMAINDLHIRVTREGSLKIGSQGREYTDSRNKIQRVWPVSFFPFAGDDDVKTDKMIAEEEQFVDSLMDDITQFIQERRAEAEERDAAPRNIPMTNPKVAKLALLGDTAPNNKKKGTKEEDTPF